MILAVTDATLISIVGTICTTATVIVFALINGRSVKQVKSKVEDTNTVVNVTHHIVNNERTLLMRRLVAALDAAGQQVTDEERKASEVPLTD